MNAEPTPCTAALAALKALLEEGREPDAASAAHWKDCPACRGAARAALRALEAEAPAPPSAPAPTPELEAEVRRQARRRILRRALGAALVVAAALVGWRLAFPELRGSASYLGALILLALVAVPTALVVALGRIPRRHRLYKRLRKGRMLSGVCLGLAERTGTPVWAWRVGVLLLCLVWDDAVLAYAVLALVTPVHPEDRHLLLRFRLARFFRRLRDRGTPLPQG